MLNTQWHPTNLFLTLSVPQRNLAGWQNSRCSDELAGKFVTGEGFVLELMKFSSISSIAWWGNFETEGGSSLPTPLPPPPLKGRFESFCHTHFDGRCRKLSFSCLVADHFAAGWETNEFYLSGWEISCVSCWEKGTDNFFPSNIKTLENALITFIFIPWGIIIHFSTSWSLGAPNTGSGNERLS